MININDWNKVLQYVENRQAILKTQGLNIKMIPYTVLRKEKGIYVILQDINGNEFSRLASGIHSKVEDLINSIEKQITRIKKENPTK